MVRIPIRAFARLAMKKPNKERARNMSEKKEYISPEVDSVLISATESNASGICEPPVGGVPPFAGCGTAAASAIGDPMS